MMAPDRRSLPAALAALCLAAGATAAQAAGPAAGPPPGSEAAPAEGEAPRPEPTPEERMARRYPQPIQVRRLVGAAILDYEDKVLGRIQTVARSPEGKVVLVIGYGGLLGFGQRLVAVPIEAVAWLGPNLAAVDWGVAQFELAQTWYGPEGATVLGPDDTLRVAITRR